MSVIFPMSKLLFAIAIGFILFKKGMITPESNRKMSELIVNVTCPCIVLNSVANVAHDNPQIVMKLFFAGIVAYLLFPGLAWCFARLFRISAQLQGTYMCMLIFF